MRWLTNLFKPNEKAPSHQEVQAKVEEIKQGVDPLSIVVHDQKNEYSKDLLASNKKVKMIGARMHRTNVVIDTAISIALATGSLRI